MQNRAPDPDPAPDLDAIVQRALERAHSDLPPEGITIQASDEATMREEIHGVTVDDAEHHRGRAA